MQIMMKIIGNDFVMFLVLIACYLDDYCYVIYAFTCFTWKSSWLLLGKTFPLIL